MTPSVPAVSMAVFFRFEDERIALATVHLEADPDGQSAAGIAAQGYEFAGTIGVIGGEPQVRIEPVQGAAVAMSYAGMLFAEKLGPVVQQHQRDLLTGASTEGGA